MSSCLFEAKVELDLGIVALTMPIQAVNEANSNEHWSRKAKRHRQQKQRVHIFMCNYREYIKLPCLITFIRYAPRELDEHDNLPYSFKWILDSLSDILIPNLKAGRADNDKRLKFRYAQVKSKKSYIKIIFDWSQSSLWEVENNQ